MNNVPEEDESEYEEERKSLVIESEEFNRCQTYVGFSFVCLQFISITWAANCMISTNSYKANDGDDGFFNIGIGLEGYDQTSYGLIMGPFTSIPTIILTFFSGYVVENFNRKKQLAVMCFLTGVLCFLNGIADHVQMLYITTMLSSGISAFQIIGSYSIAGDMFPERLTVRAFFILGIASSLSSSTTFINTSIIDSLGWRNTFKFVGVINMVVGVLCWFFVIEPKR